MRHEIVNVQQQQHGVDGPHLSHSAISCFAQCGERYRLERIERVPQAPAPALVLGTACHAAFEQAGNALLDGKPARSLDVLPLQAAFLRAFATALERADPLHVLTYREASLLAARGLAIVRAWHERVLPHYHPIAVEEDFEGPLVMDDAQYTGDDDPLLDWTFTGRRDARTLAKQGAGKPPLTTTLDFKTAEKPWDERKAAEAGMAQATAYAWGDLLDGRPISQQFTFCVLHTKVPDDWQPVGDGPFAWTPDERLEDDGITVEITYWRLHPTMGDVRAYQRRAVATARAILAGDQFAPNPSALCCWCGVLPHCPAGQAWVAKQTNHQPLPVIQRFAEVMTDAPQGAAP